MRIMDYRIKACQNCIFQLQWENMKPIRLGRLFDKISGGLYSSNIIDHGRLDRLRKCVRLRNAKETWYLNAMWESR